MAATSGAGGLPAYQSVADIPGSRWLPNVGYGELAEAVEAWGFRLMQALGITTKHAPGARRLLVQAAHLDGVVAAMYVRSEDGVLRRIGSWVDDDE